MIDALISTNPKDKAKGTQILKNVARLLNTKKSLQNKKEGLDNYEEFN